MNIQIQIIIAIIAIVPALITGILAIFQYFSSTSQPQRGQPIDLSEYKHLKVKHIKRGILEEDIMNRYRYHILLGLIFYCILTFIGIISIGIILISILFQYNNINVRYFADALKDVSTYIPFNIVSSIFIALSIIGVYFTLVQIIAHFRKYKYMKQDIGQHLKDTKHFLFEKAHITFEMDLLTITENTLSALKLMKAEVIELYPSTSPEKNVLYAYLGSKPPLIKKLTICIEAQENTCILHVAFPDKSKPCLFGLVDYYEDAAEILNRFISLTVLDLNKAQDTNSLT